MRRFFFLAFFKICECEFLYYAFTFYFLIWIYFYLLFCSFLQILKIIYFALLVANLSSKIWKMSDENSKLLEEIGTMEAEEPHQPNDSTQSIALNQSSQQQMPEEKSVFDEFEEKMNAKSVELAGKCIPNWLIETLKWPKRMEMADCALSTSSWAFTILCWPKLHGNVKPHNVNRLNFRGERNGSKGIYEAKLEKYKSKREFTYIKIPIASVPPPKYITGFNSWNWIYFLDGQTMQFIECIYSKLNAFCLIYPTIHFLRSNEHVYRLFEMLAEKALILIASYFGDMPPRQNLRGLVENAESIKRGWDKDVNWMIEWLSKCRPDRKPKLLQFYFVDDTNSIFIDKIEEQFNGSTQSANFLIEVKMETPTSYTMENELTGEVLALYQAAENGWSQLSHFLVRHPKGEEHLRADWEKQLGMDLPHVLMKITEIGEF